MATMSELFGFDIYNKISEYLWFWFESGETPLSLRDISPKRGDKIHWRLDVLGLPCRGGGPLAVEGFWAREWL